MTAPVGGNQGGDYAAQVIAIQDVRAVEKAQNGRGWNDDGTAYTVDTHATQGVAVAGPMAFDTAQITSAANRTRAAPDLPASTLAKGSQMHVAYPMAVDVYNGAITGQVTATIGASGSPVNSAGPQVAIPYEPYTLAIGFNWQNGGGYGNANDGLGITEEGTGPLQRSQHPAVAVSGFDSYNLQDNGDLSKTLNTGQDYHHVPNVYAPTMRVRRLTPTECERLQGFPDGWTQVPYRNKPASDGPRYKAIGNSMAVPVMRWIGRRIDAVDRVFTPRGER